VPAVPGITALKVGLYYKGHFIKYFNPPTEVKVELSIRDIITIIITVAAVLGSPIAAIASFAKAIYKKRGPESLGDKVLRRHRVFYWTLAGIMVIVFAIAAIVGMLNGIFGLLQYLG
jgi:hypothetical protein